MKLDDEDSGTGLDIVPESYGMDVPSACTIVIIAGEIRPRQMLYYETSFSQESTLTKWTG